METKIKLIIFDLDGVLVEAKKIFNTVIEHYQRIRVWNTEKMWGIGTPEDLRTYLDNHKR